MGQLMADLLIWSKQTYQNALPYARSIMSFVISHGTVPVVRWHSYDFRDIELLNK